jgi:hypothetical protein
MFDEIYAWTMQYAIISSSPQRPLPERAPITLVVRPSVPVARKEDDEYRLTNPELLSEDSPIPSKERFRHKLDFKILARSSSYPSARYDRKVPSRVPDFRAPIRLNKQ